jgi:MoxR-like ATPase
MADVYKKGEVWAVIDEVLKSAHRLLLFGPSGTGKTYTATCGDLRPDEKVFQITLTPDTPKTELIGHYNLRKTGKGGATEGVWQDGVGIAAWRASHTDPARLVLNEIDHAGPDAVSALHVLLDDMSTAGFTLATGEDVTPGKGLRIVATMNGIPTDLIPSLQDRFPISIPVQEVHPGALKKLPKDMQAIAAKTAILSDPNRRVSIRSWQALADLLASGMSPDTAYKVVAGERWSELKAALIVNK